MIEKVEQYVSEYEPVDQDLVVEQFGNEGLRALKQLMQERRVSYNIDYDLQIEENSEYFVDD